MDNNTNTLTSLECKEYVKYLEVFIDSHLSWKFHIDYVAFKLCKIVGIIVADVSVFNIWFKCLGSGCSLTLLQKRVIRFMNFSKPRTHAVPLFISSKILPINMLYFETMSTLMYDISNNSALQNISGLFRKSNLIHPFKTRSSSSGNVYIQYSRLNRQQQQQQ